VVRDRIELSTFRFSEGLSPFCPTVPEADNQPSSSAFPLAEDATFPETAMILQVSPYAGECRFVRVTLVLIFARAPDLCCLCVTSGGRSSPGQPPRLRPGPACRARALDFRREHETVPYSSKRHIPDFTFDRISLAVELKVCKEKDREKEMIGRSTTTSLVTAAGTTPACSLYTTSALSAT
jgi:hypothetical protein